MTQHPERVAAVGECPQNGDYFLAWWPHCTMPMVVRPIGPGSMTYEVFWGSGYIEGHPERWCAIPEPADPADPAAARARIAELEAALQPFADAWESEPGDQDRWNIWEHPAAMEITLGHLRDARAALAKKEPGHG